MKKTNGVARLPHFFNLIYITNYKQLSVPALHFSRRLANRPSAALDTGAKSIACDGKRFLHQTTTTC